jgi:hypothetical protein
LFTNWVAEEYHWFGVLLNQFVSGPTGLAILETGFLFSITCSGVRSTDAARWRISENSKGYLDHKTESNDVREPSSGRSSIL